MSGLQEAFYIISIVFMGVMFVLIIALVAVVFVIRAKINKIHEAIETRVNAVANIAEKGGELAAMAAASMVRKAKKTLSRKK